jgi:hypothetical protein
MLMYLNIIIMYGLSLDRSTGPKYENITELRVLDYTIPLSIAVAFEYQVPIQYALDDYLSFLHV